MNSIVKINPHKITTKHNQTGRYSPILHLSSDVRHVLICVIDVYPVAINWLFITGVSICCLCFWLLTPLHSCHIEASDKMAVILQMIYWLKKYLFWLKFHWSLFLHSVVSYSAWVQDSWLGTKQVASHYQIQYHQRFLKPYPHQAFMSYSQVSILIALSVGNTMVAGTCPVMHGCHNLQSVTFSSMGHRQ